MRVIQDNSEKHVVCVDCNSILGVTKCDMKKKQWFACPVCGAINKSPFGNPLLCLQDFHWKYLNIFHIEDKYENLENIIFENRKPYLKNPHLKKIE